MTLTGLRGFKGQQHVLLQETTDPEMKAWCNMLQDLELPTLQREESAAENDKVVKGQVPAINTEHFLRSPTPAAYTKDQSQTI